MVGTFGLFRPLNILAMVIDILGRPGTEAYQQCRMLVTGRGRKANCAGYFICDLAIAPMLRDKLTRADLEYPLQGVLVFHPSPLPYGRGPAAIKWAYERREPITAATWFWANDKLDGGDICQQEIVKIDYGLTPKEFYYRHMIPAMLRTLDRALMDLESGFKRAIKQVDEFSSYDSFLIK